MKWHWQKEELCEHWSLSVEELHLVAGRTDHGRMGFVVMLNSSSIRAASPPRSRICLLIGGTPTFALKTKTAD
jgi:hypothetical protein